MLIGQGIYQLTEDETIQFGAVKANGGWPAMAYTAFKNAKASKNCVLTLSDFPTVDYYFVVEPEYPPLIVKDHEGNTIFDLTGTAITERALYQYHGRTHLITKENLC